ncbi:hypothetical protein DACRYDRAFT_102022 [Dacryopinax primogenitus]|uniref:Zn(2)-C6 fungal-type domain-containing protein n=1 Tax=Dacryopinax primogenitus (strain DJM 731) TaxID=1858805 RepID=M5FP07_DACPD|nr:uncharacterized protein DACRYDRAFT_102022 [Dacryopinax primogenitus]EJT98130.1 hypothetical protein DACRYDRAFT_102022 [Dacryopinax primogenitus]
MGPTPEQSSASDDHDSISPVHSAQSTTPQQRSPSPDPPAPKESTRKKRPPPPPPPPAAAAATGPPPPGPYPFPYPGFFGYPYDPNMPPPNADGSYPAPPGFMPYGYPPPSGAPAPPPGAHPGAPMPPIGFWHPQWGPPPAFADGRWMIPPPPTQGILPSDQGLVAYPHPGIDRPPAKRRKTDEGAEGEPRVTKKKVEIACAFCRERKLRCDGVRPQCGNCSLRERDCHYQPGPPNRRGPGKKSRASLTAEHQQALASANVLASFGVGLEGMSIPPPPPAGLSATGLLQGAPKRGGAKMDLPKKKKGEHPAPQQ